MKILTTAAAAACFVLFTSACSETTGKDTGLSQTIESASTVSEGAADQADAAESGDAPEQRSMVGTWYYTEILYKDGTTYRLRNRQSDLTFRADGTYNQNIWAGNNLQGRSGTYKVSGSKLTLKPSGAPVETYTMSGTPADLTLKSAGGGGWKVQKS